MKKSIKVYSKICLSCHDERWTATRARLMNDFIIKEYRTALNPLWHAKAKKLAGTDDYEPFISYPDGKIKTVKEVEDGFEKYESSTVGGVQKGKKVPEVRRNTPAKSRRAGRVARPKNKTKKKDEA